MLLVVGLVVRGSLSLSLSLLSEAAAVKPAAASSCRRVSTHTLFNCYPKPIIRPTIHPYPLHTQARPEFIQVITTLEEQLKELPADPPLNSGGGGGCCSIM